MHWLAHWFESGYLDQSQIIDNFNTRIVISPKSASNQLPSMTINNIMALLDWELRIQFKLGQQYFIQPDLIIKGKHEALSISIHSTTKYAFFF